MRKKSRRSRCQVGEPPDGQIVDTPSGQALLCYGEDGARYLKYHRHERDTPPAEWDVAQRDTKQYGWKYYYKYLVKLLFIASGFGVGGGIAWLISQSVAA
jgi:hypothetical protein